MGNDGKGASEEEYSAWGQKRRPRDTQMPTAQSWMETPELGVAFNF